MIQKNTQKWSDLFSKQQDVLTFIAKPEGIMFLGHSKSVE